MKEILKTKAEEIGIALTDVELGQCEQYYTALIDWNTRINLTGITTESDIITKHFLDSFTVLQALPTDSSVPHASRSLIDIGSGAGFPGIALKILRPEFMVVLVESVGKKADFLTHIITTLGLKNIEVVNMRAEDLAHEKKYREKFDVATGRAVAHLGTLSEYALPFLKIGGLLIAQKTSHPEEIENAKNAIQLLGGKIKEIIPVKIPDIAEERSLIVVEKKSPTAQEYPRKPGIPQKEPL